VEVYSEAGRDMHLLDKNKINGLSIIISYYGVLRSRGDRVVKYTSFCWLRDIWNYVAAKMQINASINSTMMIQVMVPKLILLHILELLKVCFFTEATKQS